MGPLMFRLASLALLAGSTFTLAADWPQWMGPNRDDVWPEAGIVDRFPDGGAKVLWRTPVSGGFAGPAVAGGKVYITDYSKATGDDKPAPTKRNALQGKERVLCLDAKTGKEIWKHEYDCNYSISYPAGPRCTPTVQDGKVYALGAMGDLFCLDAAKGTVIWSKNFPKEYSAPVPLWGFAGHPLVHKNMLICTVGGKGSALVAFDKETGKEIWKALSASEIGYAPPTLLQAGGTTQLLMFNGTGIFSVDPDTGKEHWGIPFPTAYSMAIMAPRKDGDFLFAGGHSGKSIGIKLDSAKPAAAAAWKGARGTGLAPVSGTPFVENGVVYGIDGDGMFRAIRIATGERLWETSLPVTGKEDGRRATEGACFVTKNGDRFFLFGENGDLVIAKLSPEKYEEISRTKLLDPVGVGLGRKIVWSHPAYADRCVFARNDKEIVCVSLAK